MTEFIEKILNKCGYVVCDKCDGTGDMSVFLGSHYMEVDCSKCNGRGVVAEDEIKELTPEEIDGVDLSNVPNPDGSYGNFNERSV